VTQEGFVIRKRIEHFDIRLAVGFGTGGDTAAFTFRRGPAVTDDLLQAVIYQQIAHAFFFIEHRVALLWGQNIGQAGLGDVVVTVNTSHLFDQVRFTGNTLTNIQAGIRAGGTDDIAL
jgi:hypothetical protein